MKIDKEIEDVLLILFFLKLMQAKLKQFMPYNQHNELKDTTVRW